MPETTIDTPQVKVQKVFQKRKKLNLKVKQDFQMWLLIRVMGTVLVAIATASVILYFYSKSVVDADFLSHAEKVRKISEILPPVLLAASLTSLLAGLLIPVPAPENCRSNLQGRTGSTTNKRRRPDEKNNTPLRRCFKGTCGACKYDRCRLSSFVTGTKRGSGKPGSKTFRH